MRILIGDSLFNQRFLAVAARRAGFDEIVGAADPDDLFKAAADADVVAFDPSFAPAEPDLDVALHLLRLVPRTKLVVVSSRVTELERAALNGIAAARKRSIFDLDPIVIAMALVKERVAAQLVAERTTSALLPLEPHAGRSGYDQPSTGPSADARLVAAAAGSTW